MPKTIRSVILFVLLFVMELAFAVDDKEPIYIGGMHIDSGAFVGVFGNLTNDDSILYNDGHLTMMGDSLINISPIIGTGALEMFSDQPQYITNRGDLFLDSLILNNPLDISFDNNIYVDKHVMFLSGILYDTYGYDAHPDDLPSVTFSESASYDTTLVRDNSYIEGLVRKQGRTRFIFPIGDAYYYRPAVIDKLVKDTIVSAHYYYEWIEYPEERIQVGVELFRDEYWYISGNASLYNLTLTYDDRTSTFDVDQAGVKIVAYDDLLDNRLRLIDAESTSVLSRLAYMGTPQELDSSFVWFGFAVQDTNQVSEKSIFAPQIMTANGDGLNDKFIIYGISNYPNNRLVVVNRYGSVVYEMENYDNSWNGVANQSVIGGANNYRLSSGTYFVFLYSEGELIYNDFLQILTD